MKAPVLPALSRSLFASFFLFSSFACQDLDPSPSSLKITNGIKKKPDRLSAVIFQDGCTGTFVSPRTIITAAHCADKGFTYKGVKTKTWQSMPEWLGAPWSFDTDIRILAFSEDVSPDWISVSSESLFADEELVVAGHGIFDLVNGRGDGEFRYGTLRLKEFEGDGRILKSSSRSVETFSEAIGVDSGVGPGDSGGPLLRDGRLVGVNVGIVHASKSPTHDNIHVNLTHPNTRAFLDAAVQSGVDIRFDENGSKPFEECFEIYAKEKRSEIIFEVPHRRITSVSGLWSCGPSCEETNGTGSHSLIKDDKPLSFPQYKKGALVFAPRLEHNPSPDKGKAKAWTGKATNLDRISFGINIFMNDNDLSDNQGSLKVCFE